MMTAPLRLQFDANQDYQTEAVKSVVDLFAGLPRQSNAFMLGDEIVSNPELPFGDSWLFDNLKQVQDRNDPESVLIERKLFLENDDGLMLGGVSNASHRYPNFTIEMETGTGKTYVYLRTIYELRQRYGFSKFIVVVPSIAIYEGVIKNFEITQAHFRALYDNETVNLHQYDGSQISRLRSFATSTFCDVLVITLDAFNKATNVIYKSSEKLPGELQPFEFIQRTRPIFILDEPQNMESERAKEALRTLQPLFALRYSATHRTSPNLVYRLTPFEAFRRRLVKKIEVWGVKEEANLNQPFLAVEKIARAPITAKVRLFSAQKPITLKHGQDLFSKTQREEFRHGYSVTEINAKEKFVEFENGVKVFEGKTVGPSREEIFRIQIRETIQRHLQLQDKLLVQGIKVLSLFFIDKVANYIDEDGIIRRLFDDEFERHKKSSERFERLKPEQARNAYFAKKRSKSGEEQAFDTPIEDEEKNKEDREAEKAAFELIMRDKERLLLLDEPVAFIFAHSALKEGWDNPNVFQICTLNQTISEPRKRQEIGRGLRLAVNQQGERVRDEEVNILTVVANESYAEYAQGLQTEYILAGEAVAPPVRNARERPATRNDAIFTHAEFKKFWNELARRTRYEIHLDTDQLVDHCVELLNNLTFPEPQMVIERGDFVQTEFTISLDDIKSGSVRISVKRKSTTGDRDTAWEGWTYNKGDDLASHDPRLRGYQIKEIDTQNGLVYFKEFHEPLSLYNPIVFHTQEGPAPRERAVAETPRIYPVFNLVDRAVKETGLTRPTLNRIFRALNDLQKAKLFKNPEGFAAIFIETVRDTLANHVAEKIEFVISGPDPALELNELFPKQMRLPMREMAEANDRGLYDLIKAQSKIEEQFLANDLKPDPKVILYWKFPSKFRIDFPKIIGDYNPDWGVVRLDDEGKFILHLVRETKGQKDLNRLEHPHEARKIRCAKKHFAALGIDYRHVDADTPNWWHEESRNWGLM